MAAQWRPKGCRGFSKHHQAHTDMSFVMVSQLVVLEAASSELRPV